MALAALLFGMILGWTLTLFLWLYMSVAFLAALIVGSFAGAALVLAILGVKALALRKPRLWRLPLSGTDSKDHVASERD